MPAASDQLRLAQMYWDSAAETYEQDFSGTAVGKIRRDAVWQTLKRTFQPGQLVLEINSGTGIDALELGRSGIRVLACDLSPRMIEIAQNRAARESVASPPEFRVLATEHLSKLADEGPFDGAFSNFAGLNCVASLRSVASDLEALVTPQAHVVLCMMGRFVPLEIVWFLLRGKPRRAFHRLLHAENSTSDSKGLIIKRPTVAQIAEQMAPSFRLVAWKGIGIVVPPSYAERTASRFPGLLRFLAAVDRRIGSLPVFRGMADCVLLEFQRSPAVSHE